MTEDQIILDTEENQESIKEKIPRRDSPEWTDFILSKLEEDEFFEGYPKIDGLRRMVEMYIGKISKVDTSVQFIAGSINTIIVTAVVELYNGESWSASADANMFSTIGVFRNRLAAIADTRAKAKVFREILRLRNQTTAEENENLDTEDMEDLKIDGSQITMITTILPKFFKQMKKSFDVSKLIQHVLNKQSELKDLTRVEAVKLIEALSEYKRTQEIPKEVQK